MKRQKVEFSVRDKITRTNEIRKRLDLLLKVRFVTFQDTTTYKNAEPVFIQVSKIPTAEMFIAKHMRRFIVSMNDPKSNFKKYSYVRVELVEVMKQMFDDKFSDREFNIDKIRNVSDIELVRLEAGLGIKRWSEFVDYRDSIKQNRA